MDLVLAILRPDRGRHAAHRLEALHAALTQFSRYTATSALALALDFAVYLALTGGGAKPVLAGVLGYGAGLALHFLLSSRFVFSAAARHKAQTRLFAEFALSGLAGLMTTAIVIALAADVAGMPALPAKALATGASFAFVYWLRCTIVFANASSGTTAN